MIGGVELILEILTRGVICPTPRCMMGIEVSCNDGGVSIRKNWQKINVCWCHSIYVVNVDGFVLMPDFHREYFCRDTKIQW